MYGEGVVIMVGLVVDGVVVRWWREERETGEIRKGKGKIIYFND